MEPTAKRRQIFDEKVHVTMVNFFSGDEILRYLGEDGWKATMTCRCDRLLKGVPKTHFNYIKAAPVNARSKVARFEQPIVADKNVIQPKKKPSTDDDNAKGKRATQKDYELMELVENEKKDCVVCHVSFQSTGGTNITSVNALSNVELYVLGEKQKDLGD